MPFKNPFRRRKSYRAGTIIELLISVAAIAVIIIGAIIGGRRVLSTIHTNEAFTLAETTISNVRSLYYGSSGYGTDDFTDAAVNSKIFDPKWLDGDVPIDPWGGNVTLSGNGRTFFLEFDTVPRDACAPLATQNGSGLGGSIVSVQINGNQLDSQTLTVADASSACSEDEENTITWEVR